MRGKKREVGREKRKRREGKRDIIKDELSVTANVTPN